MVLKKKCAISMAEIKTIAFTLWKTVHCSVVESNHLKVDIFDDVFG